MNNSNPRRSRSEASKIERDVFWSVVGCAVILMAFVACASNAPVAAFEKNLEENAASTNAIYLEPEFVAARQETLTASASSLTVGRLKLSPCAGEAGAEQAWCGSLNVPLDWADDNAPEISVGFEFYPATNTNATRTAVPIEGGPGYSSTGSRDQFLGQYVPLRSNQNVLLFDRRGTGLSSVIKCAALQNFVAGGSRANYLDQVRACGRQLDSTFKYKSGPNKGAFVRASGLFGTANAVRDLAATLQALQLAPVDLYGDSYGTYFSQTMTARYPNLLRSVTLDSSYSVIGLNAWYPTTLETVRDAFGLACSRSLACAATGTSGTQTLARLASSLRSRAVTGSYRDPNSGAVVSRSVNVQGLLRLVTNAGADRTVYRDLDAAARAYLDHNDPLPLVRLSIETGANEDSGPYKDFSSGLFAAATCSDYPQLYSKTAAEATRENQFEAAIGAYPRPQDFAPFTVREWALSSPGAFDTQPLYTCLAWPAPLRNDPPITTGTPIAPAKLPVLVLSGDLDSITPPADNRAVTTQMGPSARLINLENTLHVAASNPSDCANSILQAFVHAPAQLPGLNPACAKQIPEIRAVGEFVKRISEATPAEARYGNLVGASGLKLATIAVNAAGDALFRYNNVFGDNGIGLRGGTWKKLNSSTDTRTVIKLSDAKWSDDASVNGQVVQDLSTGMTEANLTVAGPGGLSGTVRAVWNDTTRNALASLTGSIDGQKLLAHTPAP
jgi:pimeloyl-ACP methyl ester carboxylesterase